jgi:hypothetical protein
VEDSKACIGMAYKATPFRDADCRQSKTGGSNAGCNTGVFCANITAVFDQTSLRIALLPEKEKIGVLQLVEELLIIGLKRAGLGSRGRALLRVVIGGLLPGLLSYERQRASLRERQAERNSGYLLKQRAAGAAACLRVCPSLELRPLYASHGTRERYKNTP